jgi:chromosome segregation ATPase
MAKSKLNQFELKDEQEKLNLLKQQSAEYSKASAFIREWNKLNQQAKRDTEDELKAQKKTLTELAGKTKELRAQQKLVEEIGDAYDEQLKDQTKLLNNFDDIDDTFTSILNKAGKNNKLSDAIELKYNAVRNTVESISEALQSQNELSEHQVDNIIEATNKYKNFQSVLAEGKGNRTQSEYNELIKDSYKEFDELFNKISDTTEAGAALKQRLAEARDEMKSFNAAAEKSSNTLKGMDMAMDQFNGVPMMSEFGNVIKSATEGGGGLVMALAAMGAAAGALAYNLGLVGD